MKTSKLLKIQSFQFPTSSQWYNGVSAYYPIFVSNSTIPDPDSAAFEAVRKTNSALSAFTEVEMR
jgi:hypothetical protein